MTLHKDLELANMHDPFRWKFADAAARGAATPAAADVDKLALQLDDYSVWVLEDDSPLTWTAVGGSGAVSSVNGATGVVVLDADDIADTATNVFASPAELTKLAGIEALADVTDAANVNAAGATMNADTTLAGNGYFLDEDDMASDSATKVPSQQSVKAYVDAEIAGVGGGTTFPGERVTHVFKLFGTGVSMVGVGMSNGANSGGTLTGVDDADGPFLNIATSTTLNNSGALADTAGSFTQGRRDWGSEMYLKLKTAAAVVDFSVDAGWTSGTVMARNTSEHGAYFSYSTTADGTAFWRTVTADGSAVTTTATTVAVAADTVYQFRIKLNSGNVEFYHWNGSAWALVNTHTTNLPAATQALGWRIKLVNLLAGTARNIKFSRLSIRSDK